ncbi:hypothetical protein SADUNF_Sadunf16G0033500 [Salix dunnii]|uniref:Uncharacterized protein n=1 Tax=Salix dunnii TaxID=1413687 RepID=A0A835MFJ4_9ROSI|nr:hypothetical protein SADUNF_Sadunf16G0033500 [Salix dunnii]
MLHQRRPMKLSNELEITVGWSYLTGEREFIDCKIYRGYGCFDGVYSSSTTGATTITTATIGSSLCTGHYHVPSCFVGPKFNITNAQRLHNQCTMITEGIPGTSCFSFIFNFAAAFLNICAPRWQIEIGRRDCHYDILIRN